MEKICIKCGAKLKKDVKFCTSCGSQVEEIENETIQKAEHTQSKPVDKIIIPAIIVALILSVAAIIIPFVVGSDVSLSAGSVDTDALASNSVTTAKIVDGTITDADIIDTGISKIEVESIYSHHIRENVINFSHLNSDVYDAITGLSEIADGSITTVKIADRAITSAKIANNTIDSIDIAAGAVGSSEIADGAVGPADIATDAVRSDEISENAVGASEIDGNAVGYSEMAIKIRYGKALNVYHASSVTHELPSTPIAVILTPKYNSTIGPLQANVYDLDTDTFKIALWKVGGGFPITVSDTEPQEVYWIGIYS